MDLALGPFRAFELQGNESSGGDGIPTKETP
jgi:hypothetical protein